MCACVISIGASLWWPDLLEIFYTGNARQKNQPYKLTKAIFPAVLTVYIVGQLFGTS